MSVVRCRTVRVDGIRIFYREAGDPRSPPEVFEPTFSNLENGIEHFVNQMNLHSFVLYMQDFGGPVGFRMALRHPEWIAGMIVQNANAYQDGLNSVAV